MVFSSFFFFPGGADIDQLITISGMVIRSSQLIPEMQEAFFQCQVCAFSTRVEVDRGRIAEPAVCRHCNNTHSLALIHNRSVFSDKQMVRGCGGFGWRWGGRGVGGPSIMEQIATPLMTPNI